MFRFIYFSLIYFSFVYFCLVIFILFCVVFVYFVLLFLSLLRPCHFSADLPLGHSTAAQGCTWECLIIGPLCASSVAGGILLGGLPVSSLSPQGGVWFSSRLEVPARMGVVLGTLSWRGVHLGAHVGGEHLASPCCVTTPLYFASAVFIMARRARTQRGGVFKDPHGSCHIVGIPGSLTLSCIGKQVLQIGWSTICYLFQISIGKLISTIGYLILICTGIVC